MKKILSFFQKRFAVLVITIPLFLVGIGLTYATLGSARRSIYEEHDSHILDMVISVDHNVTAALENCRNELKSAVGSRSVREEEKKFLESGDSASFAKRIANFSIFANECVSKLLLRQNGKIIFSSDEQDDLAYILLDEDDGDEFWLYEDNEGSKFIALARESEVSDCEYLVLIDPVSFFASAVSSHIFSEYWIVVYDVGNGLAMHNDFDVPMYTIYSRQEILDRNDGFTLIFGAQNEKDSYFTNYHFTEADGIDRDYRLCVLPTSLTENGNYTIAASIPDDQLVAEANHRVLKLLLAAMLIGFSLAVSAFFFFHSKKREEELAAKLSGLEKEKKLTAELLHQQEEMSHHQKLETIGTLTAGVAHEFNNLLSPIMSDSLLILESAAPENTEFYDNALEIYESSQRAKELISKISRLSRRSAVEQMTPIQAKNLITGVMSVLVSSIPKNVVMEKEISTEASVFGDESQLSNMLINLALNGFQAMEPDGGVLTFSASDDGENVILSVSDTGKGIPPELMEKIFEPFFTTKDSGKGTGLGLSIAARTVSVHGGTITAENRPEGGARFSVSLKIYHGKQ